MNLDLPDSESGNRKAEMVPLAADGPIPLASATLRNFRSWRNTQRARKER